MTKHQSATVRALACCVLILSIVCFGSMSPALAAGPASPANGPAANGPKIWLGNSQSLPVHFTGAGMSAQAPSQPVSMAQGDFDQDGIVDLAVGYGAGGTGFVAIHRGNLDAFAPQSEESFQAIGRGEFPAPFLPEAQTFSVPVSPDFIAAGDFTGMGHTDLAVAARGGSTVYIFNDDGKGNFSAGQTINLPGGVTSLAEGEFGSSHQPSVLVGTTGSSKNASSLLVFTASKQGLTQLAGYSLSGSISNILFGEFGDVGPDAAFLAGSTVQILRSYNMKVVPLSLPVTVSAFALGSFLFDRNGGSQIALLGSDGSIQIAARNEFDPRAYSNEEFRAIRQARLRGETPPLVPAHSFPVNGWQIVEGFPSLSSIPPGQAPVFFRTRIAVNGADDIMWLNAASGQMVLISHPDQQPGAATFSHGQVALKPYSGAPLAALPMRLNVDNRLSVLALHQGEAVPAMSMALPDPTFNVNTTSDGVFPGACALATPNQCTLREAILEANGDTIMVPAGTYTLTIPRATDDCTGKFGALSVEHTATIVGAGQGSTIIQAGTASYNPGPANGVDMVMNVNEDLATANCPITNASASISNLTIQNGHNIGRHGIDGDGGCMEFDTGSSGAATLTLTNVTLQNCDTTQGSGGGLANFNFEVATGTGFATISNSIIQGNSVADNSGGSSTAAGGGIWVSDPSKIVMSNSQVLNNLAIQDTATTGIGGAGGLLIISKGTAGETPQTQIHSSTISGNKAAFAGGGITDTANLLIDQSTIISGNKNGQGASGTHLVAGGGLFINPPTGNSATLSKVTIINNQSTGSGGGIATGALNSSAAVTISFSRFAGNTAGTTGSNLENLGNADTVTNNWWGTNNPASTIHTVTSGSPAGTTTFDPFIVLTHKANPSTVNVNSSTTLTADFLHDNHGASIPLANIDVLLGLPITFNNAILGSLSNEQPSIQPDGTATATFTTGNTSLPGPQPQAHADAVVDNGTATANITIPLPPVLTKAFGAASVPLNGSTSLSFTLQNNNTVSLTNIAFSDTFPAGLIISTPNGLSGSCGGGTITATQATSVVSLSGATIAASNSCTFSVNVIGTAAGLQNNTTGNVSATESGAGGTASASVSVEAPPSIAKVFNPSTIAVNATTSLTFTITNPAVNADPLTGVAFTDTLPTGLTVANTSSTVCGGTLTTTAPTGIALSGATIAVNSQCQFSVTVMGAASGQYVNTTGNVTSTNGGTGNTATANLTVASPPTITKAFGALTVPLGGLTSLTFTINNPNNVVLHGVAFTDNLPAGLVVASPNGLANSCGGTPTAVAGSGSVSLTGGTVAASGSCTVVVNVQGTVAGVKNNSVQVTSTEGGTGNIANATVVVVTPPTIAKAFAAANIDFNTTTSLTFTIQNPNASVALTGVSFSDTLPPGLTVADSTSTVCGGSLITTNSSGVIALSGATIAASNQCIFTATVTGAQDGVWTNVTGTVTSLEGGNGNTATAVLGVGPQPTFSKAFAPTSVPLDGTTHSTLTFTIHNGTTTTPLTNLQFSDSLPTGLRIATADNLTGDCLASAPGPAVSTGGTVTLDKVSVPNTISLTGLGLTNTNGGTCTISVDAIGFAAGPQNNTTGQISSTEGGNGPTASASVDVVAPPSVAKVFNPSTIALNATTSLTFTITNPAANDVAEAGVAFTDTLPTGLTVANSTSTVCGGTLTTTTPVTIALVGASVAVNSQCQFSVTVTGAASGQYTNTTGNVSSTNGGTGNTATANLTVASPPSITKAFGAANIPVNGTTSLTFTISNANTNLTLTGLAFTDSLPAGIVVANPSGLINGCGGTATAVVGSGSVSLSGGTLAASAQCTVSVNVQGTTPEVANNSVQITSNEGGPGNIANAAIIVVGPPAITKAFGAASIAPTASTSLSFTINNPNTAQSLSGVAFSDNLPSGLVVSTPNGLTGSCGTGTITATAGGSSVALTSGTLAASGSCTFAVNVTGTTPGTKNNTTSNVTSTEGGTGLSASASLIVLTPPVIAKAFNPTGIPLNGISTLTVTITDPAANGSVALVGVAFTDNFPAGLTVATPNNLVNNCGGTATATAGSAQLALTGGSVPAGSSCTVSANVTSSVAGAYVNTTGPVSSTNGATGNSATATLNVALPPIVTKSFSADTVALNGTVFVNLNINNPNGFALTGIALPDNLPAGLVVATPNGASTDCGGTLTAAPGSGSFSLSGGTLAAGASCNVFVNVKDTTPGDKFNTAGPVSSNESGVGAPSNTVGVSVVLPPTISKAFGAAGIPILTSTSLTFNLANPNSGTEMVNIGLTDVLPAGLVVATPNGATGTCITSNGAAVIANPGSNNISLLALNLLSTGSCSFSVNVTGTHRGHWINTTGNVTAVFDAGGGNFFAITGGTATAAIDVLAANLTVTKTHSGNFAQRQIGATYTITVGNNGTAPTVGTVTLVDTLPSFLTATSITGTNWTCDLPSLTCTRSDVLGIGGVYDPITVTVNVAPNTPATVTNTATATGGGDLSPEVANDPTTVTVTGPAIDIIPDPNSNTVVVAAGMSGNFTFTVDAAQINPPAQVITFTCSGLPRGTACIFNPLGEAQPVTQVTMTITTLGRNNSSALLPFGGDRTPIYAVLLPVLGLVGISLVGRSGRKTRLRLAMAVIGLVVFLALWGCGGNPLVTPPGTYPITVTGTASTPSGNVSGSATVNLKVL